jgi:hypothetical protein
MGIQVADGEHLATEHRATRGSAALPIAPLLCCGIEPHASISAHALEVRGSTRALLSGTITTSIVLANWTSLTLTMQMCLVLTLGGLLRSLVACIAAKLGIFFLVVLILADTVVVCALAIASLATSLSMPA